MYHNIFTICVRSCLDSKSDHFSDPLGHCVVIFVATKVDILNEPLGDFPAVFVATKPGVLRQNMISSFLNPNQSICSA